MTRHEQIQLTAASKAIKATKHGSSWKLFLKLIPSFIIHVIRLCAFVTDVFFCETQNRTYFGRIFFPQQTEVSADAT